MIEEHCDHYREAASRRFDTVPCAICGTARPPTDMDVVPHVGRTPRPGNYSSFFPEIEFHCPTHRNRAADPNAPPVADTDDSSVAPD